MKQILVNKFSVVLILITVLVFYLLNVNGESFKFTEKSKFEGAIEVVEEEVVRIAVGGDWDDQWGATGATELSLRQGSLHDLILMVGDLSYDGKDGEFEYNIENAKQWSARANAVAKNTPILFVAGDHDSKNQDGDIKTYATYLNRPDGSHGVLAPTGKLSGYAYEGSYPYLWFSDVIKGNAKVRIVGTTSAFQEGSGEPEEVQKYLKHQYKMGSENYNWIRAVYDDAKKKDYWILHINHLPWIDMGKNQSFSDSQGLIDLAATYGVNVILTGSSHNVWRTKPLSISDECPSILLTTNVAGANPACVGNNGNTFYSKSDGLIQAHVGVSGKTWGVENNSNYSQACDPEADGEVKYYLADGTCTTSAITGIVSLTITNQMLKGDFIKIDNSVFEPYSFQVIKN